MQRVKKLKKPQDIARIKFSSGTGGKLVRIGGFDYGNVYIGRMRFKGGKWKRVAIKVFKKPLSNERVKLYRVCIARLAKAGVRLPKIAFVKMKTQHALQEEFVQVSQLFGSTKKGSKITNKVNANFKSKKARLEAVTELTKVANAGYSPEIDLIEEFIRGKGSIIPIDLDTIVEYNFLFGPAKKDRIASDLVNVIEKIGKTVEPKEYKQLYDTAFKVALPSIKKALKNYTPDFRKK